MGFHECEYCNSITSDIGRFSNTSSGDVTLKFGSGRSWMMPDMILHYVADHGWLPPAEFVDDVMNSEWVGGERAQTKGYPTSIARLHGPYEKGPVPEGFVERLEALMKKAADNGDRMQYRGG